MPIKVSCQCGQSFAANDQLAGKRVKCPKCGNPISIPGTSAGASSAQRPAAARPQQPAAPPGGSSMSDLFDEAGVTQKSADKSCPECGSDMAESAVVCIQCGYHRQLKRKLASAAKDEFAGDAHSATAAAMLRKAAAALDQAEEEAPVADHKDDNPVIAWLFLLLIPGILLFVFVAVFGVGGSALSGLQLAMQALFAGEYLLAYSSFVNTIAVSLCFLGWVFVSVSALQKSKVHGIACLLTCVYYPVYGLMNWSTSKQGMTLWLAGQIVNILGTCSVLAFACIEASQILAALGIFTFAAGLCTFLVGWLLITLRAFEDEKELTHGLLSTLLFPYAYVYGFLNIKELRNQVGVLMVGTGITIGGLVATVTGFTSESSMYKHYQKINTPPASMFEVEDDE